MQKNGVTYGKNNNASSKKTLLSAYFGTVEAIMPHGIIFYGFTNQKNFVRRNRALRVVYGWRGLQVV